MNRRSFISTITALTGIVLAKIKAPAAPQDYLRYTATGTLQPALPEVVHARGRFKFADIKRLVYNADGLPIGVVLKPDAQKKLDNP